MEPDPTIDLSCLKLHQLRGYTVNPSAIAQLFTVETCADGIPVPGLETDDFDIAEDGTKLSSEAAAEFQKSTGLRVYVSLVLDMSSSTRMALPFLIEGAQGFVNELLVKRKLNNVMIGIDVFDGSPTLRKWLLPISDPTRLNERIAQLATDYVNEDASSTNLNGAARDAVAQLQQRQIQVMNANDNGVVTVGYAVLFTDGADTAGRVPDEEAIRTLAAARYVNTSSSQVQATVATYAVPLAGPDYTPGSLETLLSGTAGGEVSSPANGACSNECQYAYTDSCDDGRAGARSALCPPGTDCEDCGELEAQPLPTGCTNTCIYASNGACDDGGSGSTSGRCTYATDCSDCGART
ncbi:MAG TPA: hypothetical protein VK509_03690, partial [Polyangiales bacterium]|nr:hypothetical protein [Polyangiales bacterium]